MTHFISPNFTCKPTLVHTHEKNTVTQRKFTNKITTKKSLPKESWLSSKKIDVKYACIKSMYKNLSIRSIVWVTINQCSMCCPGLVFVKIHSLFESQLLSAKSYSRELNVVCEPLHQDTKYKIDHLFYYTANNSHIGFVKLYLNYSQKMFSLASTNTNIEIVRARRKTFISLLVK